MEEERFKIEKARAEREERRASEEDAYREAIKSAGQVMATGTSGMPGVTPGSQQDAMLARQNLAGGTPMPESGNVPAGYGLLANVALQHGRPSDAAAYTNLAESEQERQRKAKYEQKTGEAFDRFHKGEIDDKQLIVELARVKAEHGDPNNALDALIKSKEVMRDLKKEGAYDAARAFLGGESPERVMQIFNENGDTKFTKAWVEQGKSFLGTPQRVFVAIDQNGNTHRYGEDQLLMFADKDTQNLVLNQRKHALDIRRQEEVERNNRETARRLSLYGGDGGGGSRTVEALDYKTRAYIGIGVEPNLARALAVNPRLAITPDAIQKQAKYIVDASKDALGRPSVNYQQAIQNARLLMNNVFDTSIDIMRDGMPGVGVGRLGGEPRFGGDGGVGTDMPSQQSMKQAASYLNAAKSQEDFNARVRSLLSKGWTRAQIEQMAR